MVPSYCYKISWPLTRLVIKLAGQTYKSTFYFSCRWHISLMYSISTLNTEKWVNSHWKYWIHMCVLKPAMTICLHMYCTLYTGVPFSAMKLIGAPNALKFSFSKVIQFCDEWSFHSALSAVNSFFATPSAQLFVVKECFKRKISY